VVGVNLLEYVDSAGTRRINPFSRRIEPDVVDANDAGKRGDHPAGLRIHHGQSPGLERGREQAMSNASAWTLVWPGIFHVVTAPVFWSIMPIDPDRAGS